jgi:hypothetical protein
MTRTRKTFITVLATCAVSVAIGSTAIAADYSTVKALVGDRQSATAEPSGYSSPNAIVGGGEAEESLADHSSVNAIIGDRTPGQSVQSSTPTSDGASSLNSILGHDGVTSPSPVSPASAGSSNGFDWGDALIGAGAALGLALTTALLLGMTRRRTRVEPGV